jgi:hypothetical protein
MAKPTPIPAAPAVPAALSVADLLAQLAASGDPAAKAAVQAHKDSVASALRSKNAVAIGEAKAATAEQVLAFWRKLRDLDPDGTPAPESDKRVRLSFDVTLGGTDAEPVLTCAVAGKVRHTGGGGGGGGKTPFPDGFKAWLKGLVSEAAKAGKPVEAHVKAAADALLADPKCEAGLRAIAERVGACNLTSAVYKVKEELGLVNGRTEAE